MKFIQLIITFSLLTSSVIYSQKIDLPADYIRYKNDSQRTHSENIQGSVYLNEKFQNGKILLNDKGINTLLRYNVLSDEFEFKMKPDEKEAAIVRSKVIKFVVGTSNYALFNFVNKEKKVEEGYFQILNEGPFKLLKRSIITLSAAEPAASSYSQPKPAKYIISEEYFLVEGDKPAQKIHRMRNTDVLDLIGKNEAISFVKKNKLKLKSEEEIIQLLRFLNISE